MKKTIIFKEENKIRLDSFLKKEVFLDAEVTRGEIIRQIKNGNVLVNSEKVKPSYMLKPNDKIRIDFEERAAGLKKDKNIKFNVIYEDKNFIIIDKPYGLQVHPDFRKQQDTLVNGLLAQYPEIENIGDAPETRPGIVHRLDRETSGVLVVARNQKTFLALKEKFKKREMQKTYLAVVHGKTEKAGMIDAPLAAAADYKKQVVADTRTKTKIRSAVTEYKTLESTDKFSLVEVSPKTGRTHQIRVHLSHISHPILGDNKYLSKEYDPIDAPRLMLHAKSLEFEFLGEKCFFEAPIPEDFRKFLENHAILPIGLTKAE